MPLDLLAPLGAEQQLRENYVHQLRQTINAYAPSFIFVGEALQNSLDAVRECNKSSSVISIDLDFDNRQVTVRDSGTGFPDRPALLFLGGGTKTGRGLAGMVGVGLKVVLFSSSEFTLRAKNSSKTIRVELRDANRYSDSTPPQIELPNADKLPEDEEPLLSTGTGTEVSYKFPIPPDNEGVPEQYLRDVYDECIESKKRPNFEDSLSDATIRGGFPNRLAALISSHLRRYTYLGSTQEYKEFSKLKVVMTITGSYKSLGPLAQYADGKKSVTFEMSPSYLHVFDTISTFALLA